MEARQNSGHTDGQTDIDDPFTRCTRPIFQASVIQIYDFL